MSKVNNLVNSFDARVWAKEFCKTVGTVVPEIKNHEEWVMAWFANAIMAGYDHAALQQVKYGQNLKEIEKLLDYNQEEQ